MVVQQKLSLSNKGGCLEVGIYRTGRLENLHNGFLLNPRRHRSQGLKSRVESRLCVSQSWISEGRPSLDSRGGARAHPEPFPLPTTTSAKSRRLLEES